MSTILGLILISYCLVLVAGMIGWRRIAAQKSSTPGMSAGLSVVVALRNESENIQTLIDSLRAQEFQRYEVLLVDDHSTDDTLTRLKACIAGLSHFRILSLPEGRQGKKEALSLGISQAAFDIIVTTDADCVHSSQWLSVVAGGFEKEKVDNPQTKNSLGQTSLLIGPVAIMSKGTFFSRLQQTEFVSVMAVTAAAVGLGHPLMCNGANLAFRKEIFNQAGGYTGNLHVASGDDEFLMRKIFTQESHTIRYLCHKHGIVRTGTQPTMEAFFAQRWRWAGKWRGNTDWTAKLLAVLVLIAQLVFLLLMTGLVWSPPWVIAVAVVKIILEFLFLRPVGHFLHRRFDGISFIVLQYLYPLYVFIVGVGPFLSSMTWKGRNYK